jgi:hypothetical protein
MNTRGLPGMFGPVYQESALGKATRWPIRRRAFVALEYGPAGFAAAITHGAFLAFMGCLTFQS